MSRGSPSHKAKKNKIKTSPNLIGNLFDGVLQETIEMLSLERNSAKYVPNEIGEVSDLLASHEK